VTHPSTAHVSTTSFASLGLSRQTLELVTRAGYQTPTPIQSRAIPPALAGRDVIGCAATGTGKTAAFVLPMIERLGGKAGTRALVLAPTRELALQIAVEITRFGQGRHFRSAVVIGGLSMGAQIQELRERRSVIVATPGRLVDHLERGTAKLDQIELLVLDEADRMLDMGFAPQLKRILAKLPARSQLPRQTLLFSATMAGEVAEFARLSLLDPVRVEIDRSGTTAVRLDQKIYLVPQLQKTALLLTLLQGNQDSTLVFTRTKRRADKVAKALERAGLSVARIHADRSQGQRKQAMDGFRRGQYRILVATDIAARGIDVDNIGHVINFDLPHVAEDYVHRIGRTARATKSGRASSFASPDEMEQLRGIERLTRAGVARAELPKNSPIFQAEVAKIGHLPPEPREQRPAHGRQGQRPHRQGSSHARPSHAAHRSGASSSGSSSTSSSEGRKEGTGRPPVRVGSWRPKRRGH
jgi:ATP-dependent RNA helicase RhlE